MLWRASFQVRYFRCLLLIDLRFGRAYNLHIRLFIVMPMHFLLYLSLFTLRKAPPVPPRPLKLTALPSACKWLNFPYVDEQ